MILSHFSTNAFIYTPKFKYSDYLSDKPDGIWLSDESISEYGWRQYCEDNRERLKGLAFETKFRVDTSKLLWLKTFEKLSDFYRKFKMNNKSFNAEYLKQRFFNINWPRVKTEFSGILITPYQWKARHTFMWYYPWDCASACIWDLSVLTRLSCESRDLRSKYFKTGVYESELFKIQNAKKENEYANA